MYGDAFRARYRGRFSGTLYGDAFRPRYWEPFMGTLFGHRVWGRLFGHVISILRVPDQVFTDLAIMYLLSITQCEAGLLASIPPTMFVCLSGRIHDVDLFGIF